MDAKGDSKRLPSRPLPPHGLAHLGPQPHHVVAYASGAGPETCDTGIIPPFHGGPMRQTHPFRVTVVSEYTDVAVTSYTPGSNYDGERVWVQRLGCLGRRADVGSLFFSETGE